MGVVEMIAPHQIERVAPDQFLDFQILFELAVHMFQQSVSRT